MSAIKKSHQMVPLAEIAPLVAQFKAGGISESEALRMAGYSGGAVLNDQRNIVNGHVPKRLKMALIGALLELGEKVNAHRVGASFGFDDCSDLFIACQKAIDIFPSRKDKYRRLMGKLAQEMSRQS